MYAQEEQNNLQIYLLKTNLEEIVNDIVVQHNAMPGLHFESEQQNRQAMLALGSTRTLSVEAERLKHECARLLARRMQLKQQCEGVAVAIHNAKNSRDEMLDQLITKEADAEILTRDYEDSLREKADRFRNAREYYNEINMTAKKASVSANRSEWATELARRDTAIEVLRQQMQALRETVPADLLDFLGKTRLGEELKQITEQCDTLEKTLNAHRNSENEKNLFISISRVKCHRRKW